MTINIDNKAWIRYPSQVSGGRFYSDVDKVPVTTVAHGDSVTITGSGFGSAPASLEFIGGSGGVLETTALGVRPSKSGWQFGTSWTLPVIQNDATRGKVAGGTISRPTTTTMDLRYDSGAAIPLETYAYWTWWVWTNVVDQGSPAYWQHKLGRLNYVNDIQDSDTEITLFDWTGGNGQQIVIRKGGGTEGSYYGGAGDFPQNNEWCRMEMLVYTGTLNGGNGAVHIVTNRADGTRSVYSRTSETIHTDADRLRYFIVHNYFGNFDNGGGTEIYARVDDVAIRVGSWKRVELTNNATLASATVREIQPETSWDDGSVTVTLNQGGLTAGTYWLHVVDGLGTSLGSKQVEVV